MPLFLKKNIQTDCTLAIWQITESNQVLRQMLGSGFFEHNMHLKMELGSARHYLASRVLLAQLFLNQNCHLHKDTFNKPMLEIDGMPYFVSITHSHNYAGIIYSKTLESGIDIELVDARILKVANKFMNETEMQFAGDAIQIIEKTIIWSAKETLYKIYGKKELDFKKHMHIHPFNLAQSGSMKAHINKDDFYLEIQVHYVCFEGYVYTYAINNATNTSNKI